MEIVASIVALPIGLIFVFAGLSVNLFQALLFIVIRPFSKNIYRRTNNFVIQLLWLQLIWLFDWWAHVKMEVFVDPDFFEIMGKEHAIVISNHRSDIDWLIGWVLAQRSGCLGGTMAVMKSSLKFLPVIGWAMWFSDYIFLERNWFKDERNLKSGFKQLEDYPTPFWMAIFPEGTRFTQEKLLEAQKYAAAMRLPIPQNVLIPHTKGFVSALKNLRPFVPAIYNATVSVPRNEQGPTMLAMLKKNHSKVHVHMERVSIQELPESDADIAQWCRNVFIAKDCLLGEHLVNGTFSSSPLREIGRPKKSLFVFISWLCVMGGCLVKLVWCSSFLSSWKGLILMALVSALVTFLMHIFIIFTQSQHSTPPRPGKYIPVQESLLNK